MIFGKKNGKKGLLLEGIIIYLVIALLFIGMLFVFVYKKSSNSALVEEETAKEIALMLDSTRPGTSVLLNVDDALNKNDGVPIAQTIVIKDNIVTVKLKNSQNYQGYSYSFFNKFNDVRAAIVTREGLKYLSIQVT